jgi:hypothetical protein
MREGTLPERGLIESPDRGPVARSVLVPVVGWEILDWDVSLDVPPPRRTGAVHVRLEFAGRSRPIPVRDPAAE